MKNKTVAACLALVLGPLGVHRLYLYGLSDWVAWLHPIPTALGIYGLQRLANLGQNDPWSWVLIPLLGFTFSITALHAIVYGLMSPEKWNHLFNPSLNPNADEAAKAGATGWLTVGTVVLALLVGATVLMASIVVSFQHYFEHQIEEARKISQ